MKWAWWSWPKHNGHPAPCLSARHCERSEAIQSDECDAGLLRYARNDEIPVRSLASAETQASATQETNPYPLTFFVGKRSFQDGPSDS